MSKIRYNKKMLSILDYHQQWRSQPNSDYMIAFLYENYPGMYECLYNEKLPEDAFLQFKLKWSHRRSSGEDQLWLTMTAPKIFTTLQQLDPHVFDRLSGNSTHASKIATFPSQWFPQADPSKKLPWTDYHQQWANQLNAAQTPEQWWDTWLQSAKENAVRLRGPGFESRANAMMDSITKEFREKLLNLMRFRYQKISDPYIETLAGYLFPDNSQTLFFGLPGVDLNYSNMSHITLNHDPKDLANTIVEKMRWIGKSYCDLMGVNSMPSYLIAEQLKQAPFISTEIPFSMELPGYSG